MRGRADLPILYPSDVIGSALDSLEYYSRFPGGEFVLSSDWPSLCLIDISNKIFDLWSVEVWSEDILDTLTLALYKNGTHGLPLGVDWSAIADKLSLFYITSFKDYENRKLRMKAQRANYYIRAMLSLGVVPSANIVEERKIEVGHPWDFCYDNGNSLFLGSGTAENVFINPGQKNGASFRLDKPTQISKLDDGIFSIGSLYSNGWCEFAFGKLPVRYSHNRPVILVFEKNSEQFCVDIDGAIFSKTSRNIVSRIPVNIAWRARCINKCIFVSDLSTPQTLIKVDIENWSCSVINSGPVLLTNDLCKTEGGFFVIDKMQGHVFFFDEEFKYISKDLSFGLGYGFISDPISICTVDSYIHILSWLGDRITILKKFS